MILNTFGYGKSRNPYDANVKCQQAASADGTHVCNDLSVICFAKATARSVRQNHEFAGFCLLTDRF